MPHASALVWYFYPRNPAAKKAFVAGLGPMPVQFRLWSSMASIFVASPASSRLSQILVHAALVRPEALHHLSDVQQCCPLTGEAIAGQASPSLPLVAKRVFAICSTFAVLGNWVAASHSDLRTYAQA